MIYVGVHVRRGDHLTAWMKKFNSSSIGRYEAEYFNHAMDIFRMKYNTHDTKVVFLTASDDFQWVKKNFISKGDIYFTRDMVSLNQQLVTKIKF